MPGPRENTSIGARHGAWGEEVACGYLRLNGWEIVERNCRPARDGRLELDIVAFDREADAMVFVEVKQHASVDGISSRLRSIDRRKRRNLRVACDAWRQRNRWTGGYRFDVIEVYGTPGGKAPAVDHIRGVRLFTDAERHVNWS